MFERQKANWKELTAARPGTRFVKRYEKHRRERCSAWRKPLYLVVGTVLLIAGIVLLPAPGPGFLVVFIGAGMLAEESLWTARLLDWLEVRLRHIAARALKIWQHASMALKAAIVALGAALMAAAGWVAYAVLVA